MAPRDLVGQDVFTNPVVVPAPREPVAMNPGGAGLELALQSLTNRDQHLQNRLTVVEGRLPIPLEANTTFFVSNAGSDVTGDGLTPGTAWQTLQHAWNTVVGTIDSKGFRVTIQMAPGTYVGLSGGGALTGSVGPGSFWIVGDAAASAGYIIIGMVQIHTGGAATLSGMRIDGPGGLNALVLADAAGSVSIGGTLELGDGAVRAQLMAVNGGTLGIQSSYRIVGTAPAHLGAENGGLIVTVPGAYTCTVVGTPTYTDAFAYADTLATIAMPANRLSFITTVVGGRRYRAALNGVINTSGGGPDYFPGNQTGVLETGGQYA